MGKTVTTIEAGSLLNITQHSVISAIDRIRLRPSPGNPYPPQRDTFTVARLH